MESISQGEFEEKYLAGRLAFERGRYRLSVENLQRAYQLVSPYTAKGIEAGIWLVNAYEANGDTESAIALCREIVAQSYGQKKIQASRLLYILTAPQLKRPKEWMTEIPDLTNASKNISDYIPPSKPKKITQRRQIEPLDLTTVNTKDNQFIWFTMIVTGVTVLGLFIYP